jgi:PAS domain S-box-containing protein
LNKQISKILLVEDNPRDVKLIREMLSKADNFNNINNVKKLKKTLKYLEKNKVDIILLDLELPDSRGFDTFKKINPQTPNIPIVVLTGYEDEELAVQMVNKGAQDYLIKGQINGELLSRSIRYAIERKKIEDKLRKSEKRFKDISMSMADWIWEVDEKGKYTFASGNVEQILGYKPEEIIGKKPFDFMPEEEAGKIEERFKDISAKKGTIVDLENWNLTKKGNRICLLTNGVPLLDEESRIKGFRGINRDITERKRIEEENYKEH